MSQHILIADDDAGIRDVLRMAFEPAGFTVSVAADGQAALEMARSLSPDLVVLDIGMPEMDGLTVCREIRKTSEMPILFLTAQSDEVDRIVGLEMGADDYVAKPFSPREVVARVRAIMKRSVPASAPSVVLRRGVLSVDPSRHACRIGEAAVVLTSREMELLVQLMRRPDNVMSRPAIVDAVYGTNIHVSDRTMDSHLRNLRAKLSQAGCAEAIETVHGVGIRMGPCRAV
ncbi:MAG: response regulator transcription factor [Loktanella sp.]|jgi:two-component system OmpR family response regulator|nr:response regulator transcription factor [Loktanella sp.]MDO7607561.1 response regulator transcription factor [Loktanella sp.]MDO7622522.1 response regulator transcription factor [Loktanella sp.]MDO7626283.1 response regulator transcription factor [Loktanella sp.]MDO7629289.1 response regulator transcription factor [Loktanella sp.]